jgi:hypothetical protein
MATSAIGDLSRSVGWRGDRMNRVAEPGNITSLPVIDNTEPTKQNVRTSIDCYVTGTYVAKKGQIFTVRQRYTIFLSYGRNTQFQTMQQARNVIVSDFGGRYGGSFNVKDVFIPDLKLPPGEAEPMQMYRGSSVFKGRFPGRATYEMDTEKRIAGTNIANIRRRYGL